MVRVLIVSAFLVMMVVTVLGARYGGFDSGFDGSRFGNGGYGGGIDPGFDGSRFGNRGYGGGFDQGFNGNRFRGGYGG